MEQITTSNWRIDRKLWLTADKETVVEDGDPRAAFLLCAPGDELSDADVERYGLKAKPAAANKAKPAAANK